MGNSTPAPSAPSIDQLMALAGGSGSIPTTGPDVWGTGQFGDLSVNVGRTQTSGPRGFLASIFGGGAAHTQAPPGQGRNPDFAQSEFVPRGFSTETATVNDILRAGYHLQPDAVKQLQQKLWLAGMYQGTGVNSPSQIPFGQYDENTIQAYGNLLKLTAAQNARGVDNTVDDTLDSLIQQQMSIGANGTGTTTRTSTSVSLSDPESAKAILTNVFQAYLGKGIPDPASLSAFQQALNSYEQSHPSTTTATYDASGNGKDVTSEGVNSLSAAGRSQFAQDWLFQNQGNQVANYQAATTYYNAALQALRAPVSLG